VTCLYRHLEALRLCPRQTLRAWVRRAAVDAGARAGITSDERTRLKQLERENKDLRRANAILKDASIFFASEPGGQTRK
jgi:transposase